MNGVIAAGSPQTVEAGAQILREGGNAVDAAVAAVFASFIAEACISSIGGGGFAMVKAPDSAPTLIDFFCAYPTLSRDPSTLDFEGVPVIFADIEGIYHVGRGSTAVPGNVAGMVHLLERFGTMSLGEVMQPAIQQARDGITLSAGQAEVLSSLVNVMRHTPENAALFFHGQGKGDLLTAGDTFSNPALAETMTLIAQQGAESFYTGVIAAAIVEDQQQGGLLTADDLANYRVIEREPLAFTYRGHEIYTNPPPSAGGALIAHSLKLLEQANLPTDYIHGSTEHVTLLTEVMRQTNNARADHGMDANALLARIDSDWQVVQQMLRDGPQVAQANGSAKLGSTTHISVIDSNGLSIGITTTPGATGGYVVGETGILMNNILGERDLNPQGFHNWNTEKTGKRVGSMMAPSLVESENGSLIMIGSAGSARLRSAIVQVLSNLLDWKIPLPVAVNAPRVHFQRNLLDLEAGYRVYAAAAMEARGYNIRRWSTKNLFFGGANVALRRAEGYLYGAADIRRGGAVTVIE